ncbi:MAG: hypothetical protein VX874_00215 [Pseudomonadota bacterium]|nr:hypothetical protein [Pseudomonadota bacterium]
MVGKFAGTSAASIGVVFFTFLSGVLVARMLGPEARGEYGSILLIALTATPLASLSYFDGVVVSLRSGARTSTEDLPAVIPSGLLVASFLTLIVGVSLAILLPFLGLTLIEVSNANFLLISVAIAATTFVSSVFISIERSMLRFDRFNLSRLLSPALYSMLLLLFWTVARDRINVATALWLFIIAKTPIIFVWAWVFRKRLLSRLDPRFARRAGAAGLRLHIAPALTVLAGSMDRLIGVAAWDNAVLGQYFVAFSAVGAGIGVISSSLSAILLPYLSATPKSQRPVRISRLLRLTFLASAMFVAVGFVVLPIVIPLFYGQAFAPSVRFALFMLVAMSIQPLRVVVLEASRSLGAAMPSTVIALTSIAVLWVGYFLTGYRDPVLLIVFLGLANLSSTVIGAWNLHRDADLKFDRSILPTLDDAVLFRSLFFRSKGSGE